MDLGSALLSAEAALEFLPDDRRERVFLSKAPLVEGTMAAAVQAMVGAPVSQVLAEAESALSVKREQLGGEPETDQPAAVAPLDAGSEQITLSVRNRLGLHARPGLGRGCRCRTPQPSRRSPEPLRSRRPCVAADPAARLATARWR